MRGQANLLRGQNVNLLNATPSSNLLSQGAPMVSGLLPGAVLSTGGLRSGLQYGNLLPEDEQQP